MARLRAFGRLVQRGSACAAVPLSEGETLAVAVVHGAAGVHGRWVMFTVPAVAKGDAERGVTEADRRRPWRASARYGDAAHAASLPPTFFRAGILRSLVPQNPQVPLRIGNARSLQEGHHCTTSGFP